MLVDNEIHVSQGREMHIQGFEGTGGMPEAHLTINELEDGSILEGIKAELDREECLPTGHFFV